MAYISIKWYCNIRTHFILILILKLTFNPFNPQVPDEDKLNYLCLCQSIGLWSILKCSWPRSVTNNDKWWALTRDVSSTPWDGLVPGKHLTIEVKHITVGDTNVKGSHLVTCHWSIRNKGRLRVLTTLKNHDELLTWRNFYFFCSALKIPPCTLC